MPTDILGDEYLVSAAYDIDGSLNSPSSFVVLATEDNTEIEITPSSLTLGLKPADVAFSITLNAGQIYQVQAFGDLTGSEIKAIGGKKLAVFGGALQANIGCPLIADSHLYDQLYPLSNTAKEFALIPFKDQGLSFFKIVATQDNTTVELNNTVLSVLQKGEFIEEPLDVPKILTADKEVLVTQFNPSQLCTTSQVGDPSMLQLCPMDYRITKSQFENLQGFGIHPDIFSKRVVTLFTTTENTSNIILDGQNISDEFIAFPEYPVFSYAEIELETGTSVLDAPDGVMAYTYGFGDFDAYTYHLGFDPAMSTSNAEVSSVLNYQIIPNPTNDWLNISIEKPIDYIQLFDLRGTLILEKFLPAAPCQLDLSQFPSAVYILNIKADGELISEKIIKH